MDVRVIVRDAKELVPATTCTTMPFIINSIVAKAMMTT